MEKKIWNYITLSVAATIFLAGCRNTTETKNGQEEEFVSMTEFMEEAFAPSTITKVYGETQAYGQLADFIAEYYAVPEEQKNDTIYYYQYYDFDEDGTEEILVVMETEDGKENDGTPALLLKVEDTAENENRFTVLEDFERIHTPLVVCDTMTDGWHDIILNQYGRGVEAGYLYCRYQKGTGYQNPENELLEQMPEKLAGVALLSNNMIDDRDKGNYLTLAP